MEFIVFLKATMGLDAETRAIFHHVDLQRNIKVDIHLFSQKGHILLNDNSSNEKS